MLVRFSLGERASKDLEGTLRATRLRSAPGITNLSLAPDWTRRGPELKRIGPWYRNVPKTASHSTVGVRYVNEAYRVRLPLITVSSVGALARSVCGFTTIPHSVLHGCAVMPSINTL